MTIDIYWEWVIANASGACCCIEQKHIYLLGSSLNYIQFRFQSLLHGSDIEKRSFYKICTVLAQKKFTVTEDLTWNLFDAET